MKLKEEINEGQIIQIGKDKYDVLKKDWDIDYWDSKKNKVIGEHIYFELHKLGDSCLHPTHLLKYYPKNGKIFLFEIKQEGKMPKGFKGRRVLIYSYENKRELKLKDIVV